MSGNVASKVRSRIADVVATWLCDVLHFENLRARELATGLGRTLDDLLEEACECGNVGARSTDDPESSVRADALTANAWTVREAGHPSVDRLSVDNPNPITTIFSSSPGSAEIMDEIFSSSERTGASMITRREWNLLVLCAASGKPLSPVQLQKSLFLIQKNLAGFINGIL